MKKQKYIKIPRIPVFQTQASRPRLMIYMSKTAEKQHSGEPESDTIQQVLHCWAQLRMCKAIPKHNTEILSLCSSISSTC